MAKTKKPSRLSARARTRRSPVIDATPPPPEPRGALLFEVSWEVCAQVGGIYTVLRSKAPETVRRWGDAYCLIGPYRETSARVELEPQEPAGVLQEAVRELTASGVRAHFGRWLVTGRPQALLFDLESVRAHRAEHKYLFWKDCGIGSPDGDWEHDEIVAFGFVVADFLMAVQRRLGRHPMLGHFHEWQGAAALPILKYRKAPFATIFTTHATLVGRNLCSANASIYDHLSEIDAGAVAYEHGFAHRFAIERAATHSCDVFTTVSGITSLEAEQFLHRRADVLLPNGLNVERFAAPHEFQILHRKAKEHIHEFVMGHFFPSYTIDLDNTLYVFTAGRYEYRNKGLDVFIEALHELNLRMKAESSPITVVAFIVTRAAHRALNVETLNRQAMFNELRETCDEIKHDVGRRLLHTVATGSLPTIDDLLDEYAMVRLKRLMYTWRSSPPPTIVTHDLVDDAHDAVLCHLRHRGLWNLPEDRVKVVFHPDFITTTSPLLGMEYDEFVRGCHLGVFPSYYEPWGYTPLECVVRGLPAISTDLSGFGDYVMQNFPQHDDSGMLLVHRHGRSFAEIVEQVTRRLHDLTRMSRRDRIALRNRVESHAEHFDWANLARHYMTARRMAFAQRYPDENVIPDDVAPTPPREAPARQPVSRRRRKSTPSDAG
jgi:glycogen(starch) synthase